MSIYWFARITSRNAALGLLILILGISPALNAGSTGNIRIAEVLAQKAKDSLESGRVVRSYLLYVEAAKRDPSSRLYRDERNLLAPTAKLLIRKKLESASIKDDISAAEQYSQESDTPQPRTNDPGGASPIAKWPVSSPAAVRVQPVEVAAAPAPAVPAPVEVAPVEAPATVVKQPAQTQTKSAPPIAVEANKPEKIDPWRFTFGTQILGYGTYNAIRDDSAFNPGNQLAEFGKEDFHAALRPDLKLSNSILSFSAKPRIDYDHSLSVSSHDASYYLQEWSARVQLVPSLNLSYGREVPMWGPSMSLPASNPFFRDNGRNTPLIEIGARDFGRIVWQPKSQFAISYIANTALRRGTPDFLPFRPTGAIKADYTGKSILLSGIYSNGISSPFGQRKFIGGYVQTTLGQAVRLYVEGSAQQGNPGYFPQSSALGPGYAQTKLYNALTPRTIVAGFAFTDSKAGTWTGEYIYNPFGYTSMIANSFYSTAQDLSATYLMGGSGARLAAEELARVSDPRIGPLRRNYAFAQYQRNGVAGRFDVVLRYTLNAEDRSGQGVAYITWNTSDHFQIVAVFAGLNGSLDTEFARYLHYQAQLGFRIFLH